MRAGVVNRFLRGEIRCPCGTQVPQIQVLVQHEPGLGHHMIIVRGEINPSSKERRKQGTSEIDFQAGFLVAKELWDLRCLWVVGFMSLVTHCRAEALQPRTLDV